MKKNSAQKTLRAHCTKAQFAAPQQQMSTTNTCKTGPERLHNDYVSAKRL